MEGKVITYSKYIGFPIEHGDLVRCNMCGKTMFLPCGADRCPECGESGFLAWVNEELRECDINDVKRAYSVALVDMELTDCDIYSEETLFENING